MKQTFFIELVYNDGSEVNFDVSIDGEDHDVYATLMMITRGTLMASMAKSIVCYNDQGFDVCSYYK